MYSRSLLVVLVIVLAQVSLGEWKGCGDTCTNNNQCSNALCSDCINGVCASGGTCNATCIVDSDCERLRYCYLCTGHRCGSGPLYPFLCPLCKTDADCPSTG